MPEQNWSSSRSLVRGRRVSADPTRGHVPTEESCRASASRCDLDNQDRLYYSNGISKEGGCSTISGRNAGTSSRRQKRLGAKAHQLWLAAAGLCLVMAVFSTSAAKIRSWQNSRSPVSGDAPGSRSEFGMATVGDMAFLFGGSASSGYLRDLHVFEPTTKSWAELGESVRGMAPSARSGMGVAVVGAVLYVFGGRTQSGVVADLHSFDADSLTWSRVAASGDPPVASEGMGMTAIGTDVFLFGGQGDVPRPLSDFKVLSTVNTEWTNGVPNDLATARSWMGVTAIWTSFWVFGGNGTTGMSNHLYVFDTASGSSGAWRTDPTWSSQQDAPSARYKMGMASSGDTKLYVFGGSDGSNLLSDMSVFDTVSTTWSRFGGTSPADPIARRSMGMWTLGSVVYVFGGEGSTSDLDDLHALDTNKGWTELAVKDSSNSVPRPRAGMGMADSSGIVWVFGGTDGSRFFSDLYSFDVATLVWQNVPSSGDIPSPRSEMGMVSVGLALYVFGGQGSDGYLNDVLILNPATRQWQNITLSLTGALRPSARAAMGTAAVGNRLYLFGGEDASGALDDLHVLDTKTNQWLSLTVEGEFPSKRAAMGMAAVGNTIYVFGGRSDMSVAPDNIVTFDTTTDAWQSLGSVKGSATVRHSHGMAVVGSTIFVFGGRNVDGSTRADLVGFDTGGSTWTDLSASVGSDPTAGSVPNARSGMGMVGVDGRLLLFGGKLEDGSSSYLNDLHILRAPRTISVSSFSLVSLVFAYDWDSLLLQQLNQPGTFALERELPLCTGLFPCQLSVTGAGTATSLALHPDALVLCESSPCKVAMSALAIECQGTRNKHAFSISNGAEITFTNAVVTGCVVESNSTGGLLSLEFSSASIVGSQFESISSTAAGGVVNADNSNLYVTNSTFRRCSARLEGGVIEMHTSGQLSITDSIFSNCSSGTQGGSIYSSAAAITTITGSRFEYSSSASGGGGAIATHGPVTVSNSEFRSCWSTGPGGALIAHEASATISGTTFEDISTTGAGGAIFSDRSRLKIMRSDFVGCSSKLHGGAVLSSGTLQISDGTRFTHCSSEIEGGCIFSLLGGDTEVEDTTFESCSAISVDGGGGISARGPLTVSSSTFRKCSSAGPGGAIYARESNDILSPAAASLHVTGSEYTNCSAQEGGAIYQEAGTMAIASSHFAANHALKNGGAVSMAGGTMTITDSKFVSNVAEGLGGGAMHVNDAISATIVDIMGYSNTAPNGGGGMVFWQGESPPEIRETNVNIDRHSMCAFACPCEDCDVLANCSCNVGFTGPDGGPCMACAAGKYKAEGGSAACLDCSAGTFTVSWGSEVCTACAAGKYRQGTATAGSCQDCGANTFSDAGATECTCDTGYGGAACAACAAGKYKTALGSSDCIDCPAGKYKTQAGPGACSPVQCPAGTAHIGAAASSNCSACIENSDTVNTLGVVVASGACSSTEQSGPSCSSSFTLAQGQWVDLRLSISVQQTDFAHGSEIITLVRVGGFDIPFDSLSQGGLDASCGTFTTIVNQRVIPVKLLTASADELQLTVEIATSTGVNCCPCGEFYLNAHVELIADVSSGTCACNAGYTGPDGGACQVCETGTYKDSIGSASCRECSPGTFMETVGASACESCPAGTFHNGSATEDNCISCPLNSNSSLGSSSKSDCMCDPGYTGADGSPCKPCDPGTFKDAAGSAACTECGQGSFKALAGAGSCEVCSAGKYNSGTSTQNNCQDCDANSWSAAGSFLASNCSCNVGYTDNSGTCQACAAGTYKTVTGSEPCTDCAAGTYLDTTGETACVACPDGNFSSSQEASEAITDCKCNSGYTGALSVAQDQCTACAPGKYKGVTGSADCSQCAKGTFLSAPAGTVCMTCPSDSITVGEGSQSVMDCSCHAGYTGPDGGQCSACEPGSYKAAIGSAICQDCNAGYFKNVSGPGDCLPCTTGTFSSAAASTCSICPQFSSSSAQSTDVTDCTCNIGYTGDDGDECTACPEGKYKSASGSADCQDCVAGTYLNLTGGSACVSCPADSHSPSASESIAMCLCNKGFTGPDGAVCSACALGTYKAVDGSSDCVGCGAGEYQDAAASTTCTSCPDDSTSEAGSTDASDCSCYPGYHIDGGKCTACDPGEYSATSGEATCTLCEAGTFQNSSAGTMCYVCPASDSSSPQGSQDINACLCNAGYSGPDGGVVCTVCDAGTFKTAAGSAACADCPAGTFKSFPGDGSCSDCVAGTYSTGGAHVCTGCQPNSNSGDAATEANDCICNAGYTGSSCTACVAGKYKASTGSADCGDCPANTWSSVIASDTNVCFQCPGNSVSVAGSGEVTACKCVEGFTGEDGYGCVECATGSYKSVVGSAECTACGANTYNNLTGQISGSSCVACPANSFADTGTWSIEGCACLDGFYGAASGPSGCLQCPAGSFCRGGEKYACTAHSSSPDGSSMVTNCTCDAGFVGLMLGGCAECPVDHFCAGGFNQTACPDNSTSAVGSDELTDCTCLAGYEGPAGGPCLLCESNTCSTGNLSGCPLHKYDETPAPWPKSQNLSECVCDEGFYGENGATPCTPCPANSYCPGGRAMVSCSVNSSSPAYSSNASACVCNSGYYDDGTGRCGRCEEGHWCTGGERYLCKANSLAPAGSSAAAACLCTHGHYLADGDACFECPHNTWCSGGVMTACAENSSSARGSFAQTHCECDAGYYLGSSGGLCKACPAGKYKNSSGSSDCIDCRSDTYSPAVASATVDKCFSCPAASSSSAGSTEATECVCNKGYSGLNGNTCVANLCPAGTTGPDAGDCSACLAGTFKAVNGSIACVDCEAGSYMDSSGASTCIICPNDSHSPAGSSSATSCICNAGYSGPDGGVCVACTAGYYKAINGSASCTPCNAGTYQDQTAGTECFGCPSNSDSSSQSDQLEDCQCNSGFAGQNGGTCTACTPGTFKSNSGSGGCTQCEAGKYLSNQGQGTCEACPAAYSSSELGSTSVNACLCNAGYTGPDGGTSCVACAIGKYKSATGSDGCSDCAAGGYQNETGKSDCRSCPANSGSDSGSTDVTNCLCNEGFHGENGASCTACAAGTYKDVTGSSDCLQCSEGEYLSSVGGTACLACPSSDSWSAKGSASSSACLCNAGYSGPDGGHSCTACTAGTYKAVNGSIACGDCATGSYIDVVAGTQCTACPSPDSSSVSGTASVSGCICNAGYTGHNGGSCSACAAGTYKSVNGSQSCLDCSEGTFLDVMAGTLCASCPSGDSDSPRGSANVTECTCNIGYSGSDGSTCTACPEGKYKDAIGSETCRDCNPGTFKDVQGPGTCSQCNAGTFASHGASACFSCPDGSSAPAGSSSQTVCTCNSGFSGPDGSTCAACIAGKYKLTEGSAACIDCPSGSYKETAGAGSCSFCPAGQFHEGSAASGVCSTCPAHSSAALGSNSRLACKCEPGFTGPDGEACSVCEAGTYKASAGSADCTGCPSHSKSTSGSTARSECICDSGFTGSPLDGGVCIACNTTGTNCNTARYGTCIASNYKELRTLEAPSGAVHPGETFDIVLARLDYYNQTITSASSSVIQVFTSLNGASTTDDTVSVGGASLSDFQEGIASFEISVTPTFSTWNATARTATMIRQPYLYFAGTNIEEGGTMQTDPWKVEMYGGSEVCKKGYVLDLTFTPAFNGYAGVCTACPSGKYSLDPLVGELNEPACLNCPAGTRVGGCEGGSEVAFELGDWKNESGKYVLYKCPTGHRMESSLGHDLQECQDCGVGGFIRVSNDPSYQCQKCPAGFECPDGGEPLQLGGTGSVLFLGVQMMADMTLADLENLFEQVLLDALGGGSGTAIDFALPCDSVAACQALFNGRRRSQGLLLEFNVLSNSLDSAGLLAMLSSNEFAAALNASMVAAGFPASIQVLETTAGSVATFEFIGGVLVITSCPAGTLLINSSLDLQRCFECEPLSYSFNYLDGCGYVGGDYVCPERACQTCPDGAQCTGGSSFAFDAGQEWQLETIGSTNTMRLHRCPPGYILVRDDNPDRDQCVACPKSTYSIMEAVFSTNVLVQRDSINATDVCQACPVGGECPGLNIVNPLQDFWILPQDRAKVNASAAGSTEPMITLYKCQKNSCEQDNTCSSGRNEDSLICGLCKKGYTVTSGSCYECGSLAGTGAQIGVLIGVLVLAVFIWYEAVWRPYFAPDATVEDIESKESANTGALHLKELFRPVNKAVDRLVLSWADSAAPDLFRIIISFVQIVATFQTTYTVQWQNTLTTLWEVASVLSLDWRKIQLLSCVSSSLSYLGTLRWIVMVPIFVSFLLAMPSLIVYFTGDTGTPRFKRVLDNFWYSTMFWWFLSYPLLSGFAVQSFSCIDIGDDSVLTVDVSVRCPYKYPQDETFHWAIVAVLLFPVTVPLFIYGVLRWKKVAEIAHYKLNQAILSQMLARFLQFEAGSILPKLAGAMGLTAAHNHEARFKEIHKAAKGNREAVTIRVLQSYLTRLGITWTHDHELKALFDVYDIDEDGNLTEEEFAAMMRGVIKRRTNISGIETIRDIDDAKLETLVRVPWGEFMLAEEGEEDPFTRELKQHLEARLHREGRVLSSHGTHNNNGSREVSPENRPSMDGSKDGAYVQFHDEEDKYVCPLPENAPREAKIEWLVEMGRKLLQSGGISVPIIAWNGETEMEKNVLDRVGLLFVSYKIQYWYFELIEMFRKFFMTSIIIFMYPGSPIQTASGLLVTSVFLMWFLAVKPYRSNVLNLSQGFCLGAQAVTLYYGLMTKVEEAVDDAGKTEEQIFSTVILVVNIGVFSLPFLAFFIDPGNREYVASKFSCLACCCVLSMPSWMPFFGKKNESWPTMMDSHASMENSPWLARGLERVGRDPDQDDDSDQSSISPLHAHVDVTPAARFRGKLKPPPAQKGSKPPKGSEAAPPLATVAASHEHDEAGPRPSTSDQYPGTRVSIYREDVFQSPPGHKALAALGGSALSLPGAADDMDAEDLPDSAPFPSPIVKSVRASSEVGARHGPIPAWGAETESPDPLRL